MQTIENLEASNKMCPFMSKMALDDRNNPKWVPAYCITNDCIAWKQEMLGGKCLLVPNEK